MHKPTHIAYVVSDPKEGSDRKAIWREVGAIWPRVGARMDRWLCFPLSIAYQRIRAEAGMPRPVIRLGTLHPTFASVR
jgi:hypothetical protein